MPLGQDCYIVQVNLIIKMFRVPITIHSPEIIYEYLEKRLGPLHMLIKKGQALITFVKEEDNARAANEIKDVILKGHPLRLFPYIQGELDKKIQMEVEPAVVDRPNDEPRAAPMPQVSQSTLMIDESLQIKDENDTFEKITKTHKKKVVQFICNFKTIYNSAKSREKDYAALPSVQRDKKMKQLQHYTAAQLSDTKNIIQTSYKRVRSNINKFGKQKQQIDLDPSLEIGDVREEGSISVVSRLEQHIHYINNNNYKNSQCGLAVKRIVAFNDKDFICSNQFIKDKNNLKGRIRVYSLQNEYEVMGINLNEGCYGMSILEKYLLIGNLEGSISFWNSSQGDFSNQQSFQVSEKFHSGSIFQLIRNGNTSSGYSLLTLGMDFSIKNLQVTEDLITDDIKTLFFKQLGNYSYYPNNSSIAKEIMSMDLLQEDKKVVAGSWNKVLQVDLNTFMLSSQISLKSNIFKIRKLNPNLVCASLTNSICFLDPRAPKRETNFCQVMGQIKALCAINDTIVSYGSGTGQIGLIDTRSFSAPFWRDAVNHRARIYDITKIGSKVVSGDQAGHLVGWTVV